MFANKIGVFVDLISQFTRVSNFFPGEKIDYDEYLRRVEEVGPIVKSNAYGAAVGDEANAFIKCLEDKGFDVKYVNARVFNGKPIIKYTDRTVDIIVDIIKMIDRIDMVVIGSSNINITPFLHYLKEKGIIVVLFACNIPKEMKVACDEYWDITEHELENKRYIKTEVK